MGGAARSGCCMAEAMIENRFELPLLAAARARSLRLGAAALVESRGKTPAVIALDELAKGKLPKEELRQLALDRLVLDRRLGRMLAAIDSRTIGTFNGGGVDGSLDEGSLVSAPA